MATATVLPAPKTAAGPSTGELVIPLALVAVVFIMVIPLPALLLDLLLAVSIALALVILMVGLYNHEPLQFSTFPSVLLVVTLFRLALNVASTRMILLHGHEGPDAAGHVIQAFGNFVVGGSYAVGTVVFLILVIINFAVITKGAGRIAEVAARFTLDAMPGQAARDRRRPEQRSRDREGRARAPARDRGRGRLLRRDGRRLEVRARRRDRRARHHRDQHRRRLRDRRRAARRRLAGGRPDLHGPDDRRRPRLAASRRCSSRRRQASS
jgi:hypothetical protein